MYVVVIEVSFWIVFGRRVRCICLLSTFCPLESSLEYRCHVTLDMINWTKNINFFLLKSNIPLIFITYYMYHIFLDLC